MERWRWLCGKMGVVMWKDGGGYVERWGWLCGKMGVVMWKDGGGYVERCKQNLLNKNRSCFFSFNCDKIFP